MKQLIKIIFLTIIFTVLIFVLEQKFFYEKNNKTLIEEEFIENNFIKNDLEKKKINEELLKNELKKQEKKQEKKQGKADKIEELNSAKKYFFHYFPAHFKVKAFKHSKLLSSILKSDSFDDKTIKINLELYEVINDVRGKLKSWVIKLFWILEIKKSEFVSVFIHEFAHYTDIYFFEKKLFKDPSEYFYSISWESTKVIKWWQTNLDFVSWYAMTNKYEDFAESYTYYVLHNDDFLNKLEKSYKLALKYEFLRKYVFRNSEFKNVDFWEKNKIKDYYWDITKISFNLENFLQYLKKDI